MMQYKLFSTNDMWLPNQPAAFTVSGEENVSIENELEEREALLYAVNLPKNALLGGEKDCILEAVNVAGLQVKDINDKQAAALMTVLAGHKALKAKLEKALSEAAQSQVRRMLNEADGNFNPAKHKKDLTISMEEILEAASTSKTGYIVWLKTYAKEKKKKSKSGEGAKEDEEEEEVTTEHVLQIKPAKLSPKSLIDQLEAKQQRGSTNKQQQQQGELTTSIVLLDDVVNSEEISGAPESSKNSKDMLETKRKKSAEDALLTIDGLKLKSSKEKQLYNGAKTIAAAANYVLDLQKAGDFNFRQVSGTKPQFGKNKGLCKQECEFYEQRRDVLSILKILQREYDEAPEWTIAIRSNEMTEAQKNLQERRAELANAQLLEAQRTSKTITKPGHENSDPTRESLTRPGLNEAFGAEVQMVKKSNQREKKNQKEAAVSKGKKRAQEGNDDQAKKAAPLLGKQQEVYYFSSLYCSSSSTMFVPLLLLYTALCTSLTLIILLFPPQSAYSISIILLLPLLFVIIYCLLRYYYRKR